MPIDTSHEQQWIAGLRAGQLDIFRQIYDAYAPVLRRFARVWTPRDVAEDIVQEVFFDIWQRRDSLDLQNGTLASYLFSAVRNHAFKHLRHQTVVTRTEQTVINVTPPGMGTAPESPDTQLMSNELSATIRSAIAHLPDVQRAVLLLRWTQGFSYAQIAAALAISENAAMLHVSRARKALQPVLSQLLGEFL